MIEDLRRIGDELEAAVAIDIVHAERASARNNDTVSRHVSVDHIDSPQEALVLTDTSNAPSSTSAAPKRRRTRRGVVVVAALGTLAVGGAAAATAITMSSDDVSTGLPGGSAIFEGTDPTCSTTDGIVFDCTLAHAPTQEVLDDYTGSAQLFIDQSQHIAGGCRGATADGLQWTCYVGDRAVAEGILSADLLGELSLGPSRG